MQRIMVIGPCGAGKSTLSRKLAELMGHKLIHLDKLHWKPNWVESEVAEFRAKVAFELQSDNWVVDGNYSSTYDLRLDRADTVIWLDLPMPICMWRVIKRILQNYGKTRDDLPSNCPERIDFELLHYVMLFPIKSRPKLVELVKNLQPQQQLFHLRNARQVRKFWDKIVADSARQSSKNDPDVLSPLT